MEIYIKENSETINGMGLVSFGSKMEMFIKDFSGITYLKVKENTAGLMETVSKDLFRKDK